MYLVVIPASSSKVVTRVSGYVEVCNAGPSPAVKIEISSGVFTEKIAVGRTIAVYLEQSLNIINEDASQNASVVFRVFSP